MSFLTQLYIYIYVHVCDFLHFGKCQKVLISLLIGLAGAGLVSYQTTLPVSLDLIPITQFFVGIAYEYKEEIGNLRNVEWTAIFVQFMLFLIFLSQNGSVDLFGRKIFNSVNYYATALMGSIIIFSISCKICGEKTGNYSWIKAPFVCLGVNSLYIYLYHSLFFQVAGELYNIFIPSIYATNMQWIPNFIFALLCGILLGMIIRHTALAYLFGNRPIKVKG